MTGALGGRLLVGVLFCIALLAAGPGSAQAATTGPRTIEEIVATLRTDPILVEPVLGTGDAAGVHDVLTRLAADVDVPVYVVLASLPLELRSVEYPAEQAAVLLNDALGDGLYFIHFSDGIGHLGAWGAAKELDLSPGRGAEQRARDLGPRDYNVPTAALEAELILHSAKDPGRAISDDELRELIDTPRAFVPELAQDQADQAAQRWVVTIATALAVLIAGLFLTRFGRVRPDGPDLVAQHRGRPAAAPRLDVDTATATAAVARARRRYERLSAADLASPHADAAAEALTAADLVIDSDDRLDAVGAWVLALQADREIQRIRKNRRGYLPCVVNPEHGEASTTIRLAGSSIDAPACAPCGVRRGEFLTARTWRGERPYLDTSTVWARTGFGALVDDLARQVIADQDAR